MCAIWCDWLMCVLLENAIYSLIENRVECLFSVEWSVCLLACSFVRLFVFRFLMCVSGCIQRRLPCHRYTHSLHSLPQLGQSNLNAICVFGNPTDCCTLRDHVDGHLTWNVVRIKTMEFIKRTNYPSEWREWVTYAWLQTKSHVKWQQQHLSSDGSMDH